MVVCDLAAAPHFTEKPEDVQKTIDDTLVWECKASAKPKPSYRWLKNGEPLDHIEVRVSFKGSPCRIVLNLVVKLHIAPD